MKLEKIEKEKKCLRIAVSVPSVVDKFVLCAGFLTVFTLYFLLAEALYEFDRKVTMGLLIGCFSLLEIGNIVKNILFCRRNMLDQKRVFPKREELAKSLKALAEEHIACLQNLDPNLGTSEPSPDTVVNIRRIDRLYPDFPIEVEVFEEEQNT